MSKFFQNRPLIVSISIIILLSVYLNRAYSSYYDHFDKTTLVNPTTQTMILIGDPTGPKVKYTALGDSLTAGVGATNSQDSYPAIIAHNLSQPSQSVELQNLAVSGAGVQDLINSQLTPAISQNPDLITVLIGVNDIHGLLSPDSFQGHYDQLVTSLKTRTKAKIILINIPLLGYPSILFPPYDSLIDLRTQQFNQKISSIATKHHLKLIDLYSPTLNQAKNDRNYYSGDLFHPSANTYRLWSQLIDVR